MAKKKRKLLFVKWWSKLNSSAQAFVLLAGVFSAGFTAGMLFNNRNHSYEIIENNQRHNLDLKRQHDEFEEKLTDIKNQLIHHFIHTVSPPSSLSSGNFNIFSYNDVATSFPPRS